ncbi:MAG TPA: 5-formyltetrahydrofolate cyclo-ligase [Methanoregula sp.]|nr:5-formyltetrahydrofolate cyclo-ligase [Methanoregula sp.]
MADSDLKAQKKVLRDHARHVRCTLSQAEIEEKSACICMALQNFLEGIDPVMVYVSKPLEVNTRHLIEYLIAGRGRVIVPVIERETVNLRLSWLDNPSVLVESTFRVHEPTGNEIPARPEDVKVAIIPVLGFDRKGNRLGYGAGYYDRFLARYPDIIRIGLAFACQELSALPCEDNDIKMDLMVTENGIYHCGGNSHKDARNLLDVTHHTLK